MVVIALLLIAFQFTGGHVAAAGGNISISDATLTEANSGTTNITFTISISAADPVNATTVTYTTLFRS